MPGIHRDGDKRYCGGTTIVSGQSTVFVEGKLAAVEGDLSSHGGAKLKPVYGAKNIYINGKRVICAAGDEAEDKDNAKHPALLASPQQASGTVIIYGGGAGGGS